MLFLIIAKNAFRENSGMLYRHTIICIFFFLQKCRFYILQLPIFSTRINVSFKWNRSRYILFDAFSKEYILESVRAPEEPNKTELCFERKELTIPYSKRRRTYLDETEVEKRPKRKGQRER